MKKLILMAALVFGTILFTNNSLLAQPGFDDDTQDTPIDGGISLLVGAGLAFGAKKVFKAKQEATKQN